ncbi:MAG: hypothetical protein GX163_11385 [Bacteroidetes bacterium]|jgi:hypothetical protein|nr:hypothetical protein [Bacteroidota bacterium]
MLSVKNLVREELKINPLPLVLANELLEEYKFEKTLAFEYFNNWLISNDQGTKDTEYSNWKYHIARASVYKDLLMHGAPAEHKRLTEWDLQQGNES